MFDFLRTNYLFPAGLIAMPLHILIILDTSAYTGQSGFHEAKLFIIALLNRYFIKENFVTFTLIYNQGSDVRIMAIDGTESLDSYINTVFNIPYKGGDSELPKLFDFMKTFLESSNHQIPMYVFVLGSVYVEEGDYPDVRRVVHEVKKLKWTFLFVIPSGEKLTIELWEDVAKPGHIIPLYRLPHGQVFEMMHAFTQWIHLRKYQYKYYGTSL
jgi:hypothetical protein